MGWRGKRRERKRRTKGERVRRERKERCYGFDKIKWEMGKGNRRGMSDNREKSDG